MMIKLYQETFSPGRGVLGFLSVSRVCRFYPSCSDYALESVRQYGLFRGAMLSLKRILRCNPFSAGGYDPVKN